MTKPNHTPPANTTVGERVAEILDSPFTWFVPPNDEGKWQSYTQRQELATQAITDLLQAELKKFADVVMSKPIPKDWDDELDSIQNWKYYDDYRVNAFDFVSGYNKSVAEQRTRADEYLKGLKHE